MSEDILDQVSSEAVAEAAGVSESDVAAVLDGEKEFVDNGEGMGSVSNAVREDEHSEPAAEPEVSPEQLEAQRKDLERQKIAFAGRALNSMRATLQSSELDIVLDRGEIISKIEHCLHQLELQ